MQEGRAPIQPLRKADLLSSSVRNCQKLGFGTSRRTADRSLRATAGAPSDAPKSRCP